MKKGKYVISFLMVIILIGIIYMFNINNKVSNHPLNGDGTIKITVEEGDSYYSLLSRLKDEKKINNLYFFKYKIKMLDNKPTIKPGTYNIKSNVSLKEFLTLLSKGGDREDQIKLTIPEGFTANDIGDAISKTGLGTKEEFLKALKEYKVPNYVIEKQDKRYALEGYLFPDTYSFKKGTSMNDVIATLIKRFEEVLKEVEKESGKKIESDEIDRIITIASMIEKEAGSEKERPIVSSVINNRIENDMKLQIDATVLYALGKHKEVVTIKDTEIESPYNTYYVSGLPIGAISNPSKSSILAVLNPEKTDYLFYVLKNDGSNTHKFSKTYEEHEKAMKENGY